MTYHNLKLTKNKDISKWVILGSHPSINSLCYTDVQRLTNRYPTIRLNSSTPCILKDGKYLPRKLDNVDFLLFTDVPVGHSVSPYIDNSILIIPTRFQTCYSSSPLRNNKFIMFEQQSEVATVGDVGTKKNGISVFSLFFKGNSSQPAMNFALLNGAKDILLIGVEYSEVWARSNGSHTEVTATYRKENLDALGMLAQQVRFVTFNEQSTLPTYVAREKTGDYLWLNKIPQQLLTVI